MTHRPTLLALATDAFGGRGGIAQYNRDLLRALAEDWRIEIAPRYAPDPLPDLPASLVQRRPRAGRVRYAIGALVAAAALRPRAIWCGHLYMAPLAAGLARMFGCRLLLQLHGIEAWCRPSPRQIAALNAADAVFCVSRYTRAQILGHAALDPARVWVLPNTVGSQFTPGARAAARQRLALPDAPMLLTVGRLAAAERYKGHDDTLRAVAQLQAEGRQLTYLIAGDGDDRPRLQALAAELGVAATVRFTGAIAPADLPDLYRAADLFVMPSRGEGFGISFLEALACGTPVIGLAVAGAVDPLALLNDDDGRALDTDDGPPQIAQAISEMLQRTQSEAAAQRRHQRVDRAFGQAAFGARARALLAGIDR